MLLKTIFNVKSEAYVFNKLAPILGLLWSTSQFRWYWSGQDQNLVDIIADITVFIWEVFCFIKNEK
jgi:hypothetical protein